MLCILRQLQVPTGAERGGRFQTEGRYCGTGSATRATSCVNPAPGSPNPTLGTSSGATGHGGTHYGAVDRARSGQLVGAQQSHVFRAIRFWNVERRAR